MLFPGATLNQLRIQPNVFQKFNDHILKKSFALSYLLAHSKNCYAELFARTCSTKRNNDKRENVLLNGRRQNVFLFAVEGSEHAAYSNLSRWKKFSLHKNTSKLTAEKVIKQLNKKR